MSINVGLCVFPRCFASFLFLSQWNPSYPSIPILNSHPCKKISRHRTESLSLPFSSLINFLFFLIHVPSGTEVDEQSNEAMRPESFCFHISLIMIWVYRSVCYFYFQQRLMFESDSKFQQHVRVYNMMLEFTSLGAKLDNRFNNDRGPPILSGYCNRPFQVLWNQPFRVFEPTPRQASCYITPIPPKGQNPEPPIFENKHETTGDINEQATQQQRIWQTRTN